MSISSLKYAFQEEIRGILCNLERSECFWTSNIIDTWTLSEGTISLFFLVLCIVFFIFFENWKKQAFTKRQRKSISKSILASIFLSYLGTLSPRIETSLRLKNIVFLAYTLSCITIYINEYSFFTHRHVKCCFNPPKNVYGTFLLCFTFCRKSSSLERICHHFISSLSLQLKKLLDFGIDKFFLLE